MSDLNEPKKETVRITLPPRVPTKTPGEGGDPRDTVRINLPAHPPGNGVALEAPKMARPPIPSAPARPAPPPPMARPPIPQRAATTAVRPPALVPKPPVPAAGDLTPPSGLPISPVSPAPKVSATTAPAPPAMPPRPKVLPPPPRVIPPAALPAANAAVSQRLESYPAATTPGPKKETARINILPEPVAPPTPAVKMSKTQPLLAVPTTKVRGAAVTMAPTPLAANASSMLAMLDDVPMPVCWVIFSASSLTLLIQIWNYLAV